MGRIWVVLGLSCLAAAPQSGWAESNQQPVEVAPVLVSPRRIPGLSVNASEFPGHATVITRKEIERSGATSLLQLMSQANGVTLMDTIGFGLGADSSVNLRGVVNGSRTNVLVLVDGVRQNRVTGDEIHWQAIPLEDVERVEIIRGGSSLIYGEGALAGVISITTKHGADAPLETEEGVEFGSFGRQRYRVCARGRMGPLSYGTAYHRDLVSGYRESTKSRATTTTNHLGLEVLPSLHVETNVLTSEDTSYFAGGLTPQAAEARRRQAGALPGFFENHSHQVSLDTVWHGPEGLSATLNTFWRSWESDSDTSGSRFATIAPSRGLSLRGGHETAFSLLHHTLVAGIDLLDEKASTGSRGGSRLSETNKGAYGLFAEETIRVMDRVSLVTGLRYDRARFDEAITFPAFDGTLTFEGWSPKVGISANIAPPGPVAHPLTLYANFARPFKAPNVDDFSVFVPSGFIGNINLKPQQGADYEVGLRAHDRRLGEFDASWFSTRIDDEIIFNDLTDQSENFDTVRTGLETSLKPALPIPHLTGTLTYTFVEAKFRKGAFNDHTLPGTPEHRVTANLTYEPVPHLCFTLDWQLVQDFFRINDFNNRLPGDNYGVLNLGVRYVHEHVTVYGRIDNVTNEEYSSFQSSDGVTASTGENPAPPTTLLIGLTVTF